MQYCLCKVFIYDVPWVPEVILFSFASEASKQRGEAASTRREAPSEPAKRLIFTPAIRQRASGTRVFIT